MKRLAAVTSLFVTVFAWAILFGFSDAAIARNPVYELDDHEGDPGDGLGGDQAPNVSGGDYLRDFASQNVSGGDLVREGWRDQTFVFLVLVDADGTVFIEIRREVSR
jgi:hypothetical protein